MTAKKSYSSHAACAGPRLVPSRSTSTQCAVRIGKPGNLRRSASYPNSQRIETIRVPPLRLRVSVVHVSPPLPGLPGCSSELALTDVLISDLCILNSRFGRLRKATEGIPGSGPRLVPSRSTSKQCPVRISEPGNLRRNASYPNSQRIETIRVPPLRLRVFVVHVSPPLPGMSSCSSERELALTVIPASAFWSPNSAASRLLKPILTFIFYFVGALDRITELAELFIPSILFILSKIDFRKATECYGKVPGGACRPPLSPRRSSVFRTKAGQRSALLATKLTLTTKLTQKSHHSNTKSHHFFHHPHLKLIHWIAKM